MDLSIIIVNWNTADLLIQCLESIYANPPKNRFEVLVLDNDSSDQSVPLVQQRFPQVTLLASKENLGFAGGNNQAIQQSQGRYVLLLNPDTEVKPGALDELTQFMEANPQAGAAGSCLLNPDGTLQHSCYPFPTPARELWRLLHLDALYLYALYRMDTWNRHEVQEVDVIQGASLILRREVLNQVGLLDDTYFMYTEEVDLCYRIQKQGWQLYWIPQSQVIHYGGQSTKQVATKMFLCLYESKLIFIRKHHGWLAAQLYKLILMLITVVRLIITPLVWLERPTKRQKHLSLANNYRRLLVALPKM